MTSEASDPVEAPPAEAPPDAPPDAPSSSSMEVDEEGDPPKRKATTKAASRRTKKPRAPPPEEERNATQPAMQRMTPELWQSLASVTVQARADERRQRWQNLLRF